APADVTRVVPAVPDAPRSFVRKVMVRKQNARILQYQFAFVRSFAADESGAGTGIGNADGSRRARLACGMRAERHGATLRHAVHDQRFGVGKVLLELIQ